MGYAHGARYGCRVVDAGRLDGVLRGAAYSFTRSQMRVCSPRGLLGMMAVMV